MKKARDTLFCIKPVIIYLIVQALTVMVWQIIKNSSVYPKNPLNSTGGFIFDAGNETALLFLISSIITFLILFFSEDGRNIVFSEEKNSVFKISILYIILMGTGYYLISKAFLSFASFTGAFAEHARLIDNLETESILLNIAALSVMDPLTEELVFRAGLQRRLKKHVKASSALFIQAALFSVIHANPVQIIYAFFAGLILGYIYEKTDSYFSAVIFHCAFNSANLLIPEGAALFTGNQILFSLVFGLILFVPAFLLFRKKV